MCASHVDCPNRERPRIRSLLRAGPPLVPFAHEIQPKSHRSAQRRTQTGRRTISIPAKPQASHSFSTETPTCAADTSWESRKFRQGSRLGGWSAANGQAPWRRRASQGADEMGEAIPPRRKYQLAELLLNSVPLRDTSGQFLPPTPAGACNRLKKQCASSLLAARHFRLDRVRTKREQKVRRNIDRTRVGFPQAASRQHQCRWLERNWT